MTEKTHKNSQADQADGPLNDQAVGSDSTDRSDSVPSERSAKTAKAVAESQAFAKPDVITEKKPSQKENSAAKKASAENADAVATKSATERADAVTAKGASEKADTAAMKGSTEKVDATAAKSSTEKADTAATKTSPAKPGSQAPSAQSSGSGGGSGGRTPPPASFDPSPKKPSSVPVVVLAVGVVLLAGGLWYQHATSKQHLERLESRATTSADQARQAQQQAQQALTALNQQQDKISALAAQLQESRAELDSLSSAFQTITDRGSDLVLLNDIDHLVVIAQQQLQLNGNVANAIISLETAQAQLARANRPALASLQQTINGDLDRLRAATTVDIALLSSRLDELARLIVQAPLLVPDDAPSSLPDASHKPAHGATQSSAAAAGIDSDVWWKSALAHTQQWTMQAFASLRHDFGQLISVRRVDDAAALLISPDQAIRFRDSLRQRILTAQLALMMDQSLIWETETDALLKAIESRFDSRSSVTRQAVRIARDIADTAIDTPLPDVANSIKALEAMNEQMGRRSLPEPPVTDQPGSSTQSLSDSLESPQPEDDLEPQADAGPPAGKSADDSEDLPDDKTVPGGDDSTNATDSDIESDTGEQEADSGYRQSTDDGATDSEQTDTARMGHDQVTGIIKQSGTQG